MRAAQYEILMANALQPTAIASGWPVVILDLCIHLYATRLSRRRQQMLIISLFRNEVNSVIPSSPIPFLDIRVRDVWQKMLQYILIQ